MGKFKVSDKHVAFVNAIAGGMNNYEAYQQFMSPGKKAAKMTAAKNASVLLKRPEMKELLARTIREREQAITGVITRNIAKEFSTILLNVDELDAYHSAIVQGLVEVEEVVPQFTVNEILDNEGKVVKRQRVQSFVRVKRPPNIREKQISIDALYKRNGNYAPSRLFAGVGRVNDEGEIENVERYIILSNGDKLPLLPTP